MARLADPAWQLGAFAFEVDFIDSAALGSAVATWADNPEKTLLDVLIQQESLMPDDVPLLKALWMRQQSLERTSTVDGQFDLDSKLAIANDGSATSGHFSARPNSQALSSVNRFQIVRPIASGGLGQVSLARDSHLNRQVALKEILPRFQNDSEKHRRFLREAEITGELEHPAIVPIYSVGFRDNGSPYYAMRLIHGRTFRQVVEEHFRETQELERYSSIGFRRILGMFVEVCHAIEFAHAKNIVHRDIKPANVIVGENGETMVVDWGMAKKIAAVAKASDDTVELRTSNEITFSGNDDDLTNDGVVLGTPAYMSPEQAAGEFDRIGTASDLFSLGATLYFLLTGNAPYSGGTHGEIVKQAVDGTYEHPRRQQPRIPAPLEAICLKAMAIDPDQRYSKISSLIDDIERWLADEPVSILPDTLSQKVWRYMRQNKLLSQVVFGSVAVVSVTAVVFSLLLNHQSKLARAEKRTALMLAQEKSEIAEEKTELADKVRSSLQEANAQNKLSLSTLRTVVTNIQRKLKPIDGAQGVRREILAQALVGLSKVAKSLETRTEADRATALAHSEIGMIYLTVGNTDSQNATQLAIQHFELSRDISRRVAADLPNEIQPQRDISIALEHIGDAQVELGELALANEAYRESLAISSEAEKNHPGNPVLVRDVAFGWEKIGNIYLQQGQVDNAREAYVASQASFQSLLDADPENHELMRDCQIAFSKIGNVYGQESNWEMAAKAYRDSLAMANKGLDKGSQVVQSRDKSVIFNKLGDALHHLGQLDEAASAFQAGFEIAKQIVNAAPDSTTAKRDLSISLVHIADLAVERKEFGSVESQYEQSLQLRRALAEWDPLNFAAQIDVARVLSKLGRFETITEQPAKAIIYYQESRKVLDSLNQGSIDESPEYRLLRDEVREALQRLAP
jgi:serine/threonine protein kinase